MASGGFTATNSFLRMSLMVRLRLLGLPIALPETCHSRWSTE
jgi:hypothetical protein